MYLHEPTSGGSTTFRSAGLSVTPERGNAIMFYNVDYNGGEDKSALHASDPVVDGAKWVAVKWMRERSRGYS
jgi:prolyl 4-hydroxylase